MKKIVIVNASPRTQWNTATLLKKAGAGAESQGAEIVYFDLYKAQFTGCISCFGCKLSPNLGRCIKKDGLTPILEEIRTADGLILGTPNYFGDVSSGFRAFYERLVFQYLSYKTSPRSYNERKIPVLFIMTSNASDSYYPSLGYDETLQKYGSTLDAFIGKTKFFISGNTLQVKNYDRFDWTLFDVNEKIRRHEEDFPKEEEKAFILGKDIVSNPW